MPLASLQPEARLKVEARQKPKATPEGTPPREKRIANILKDVMKPAKVASPAAPNIIEPPLSASVAKSVKVELEVAVNPKINLDLDEAGTSKTHGGNRRL